MWTFHNFATLAGPVTPTATKPPSPSPLNYSLIDSELGELSPIAPDTELPITLPVAHPKTASITLEKVTPHFFRHGVRDFEGPIVLRDISPAHFQEWQSRYPELLEADDVRYEYNPVSERMIIKCTTSPIHDSLQMYLCRRIMKEVSRTRADGKLLFSVGTSFTDFEGDYAYSSQKLPDAYIQVCANPEFPTVVAEAGWSEDLEELIEDARLWIVGSNFRTRVVILTAFTEVREGYPDNAPADNIPDVPDLETEQQLMGNINESRTVKAFAESLLALHRRRGLAVPLLKTIHATLHIYRLDDENNLYESFAATVLPASPPSEVVASPEGDGESTDESVSNSSADSVAQEPDFYLTLKDLFGAFPPPRRADSNFRIGFSVAEFRKAIAQQVPVMEKLRSVHRAVQVLKKKGFYEEPQPYSKSRKRKVRD